MADQPKTALLSELEQALLNLSITNPDETALSILNYSAQLTPDDAQPPISTTRLFAGVVAAGQSLVSQNVTALGSYAAAVALALAKNSALQVKYQNSIAALFKTEPPESALDRLGPNWFSNNVTNILGEAAKTDRSTPLSDAIVRAMLKYRAGLLYSRIDMNLLAAEVERLRAPEVDPATDATSTLQSEVDAALDSLGIRPLEDIRSRLVRAATVRADGEELRPLHVFWAMLPIGNVVLDGNPTDPSVMFSEALKEELSNPSMPPPPTYPPASWPKIDPSNPVRFAEVTRSLLIRAFQKQQMLFLNPALGAKGMVASLLTMSPEEVGPEAALRLIDFAKARTLFRTIVRTRLADRPDLLQQWNRALEFESGIFAKLTGDQPWAGEPRDHLDITHDALAIANVAAGKASTLPLAFGVFGDWGSGKTFFMRLIHEQIGHVVASKATDDGFEHAIVQIQFNAWHYAETNLWASLVGHIFDELDRWMTRGDADASGRADDILKRLATSRQLTLEAASELVQRRKEHAKAANQLAEAQRKLSQAQENAKFAPGAAWRVALQIVRDAIAADSELQWQLGSIQDSLGLRELASDNAKVAAALNEIKRSASAGTAALGGLWSMFSPRTAVLAILALFGVPALLFALHNLLAALPGWSRFADVARGFEAIGGLLATAAVLVTAFARYTTLLADKLTKLRQCIDQQIAHATATEQTKVSEARAELAKWSAEVEQARSVLHATAEHVAAALRDYAEETGGMRLRRFVRARTGEEAYAKHLGLVSTIRKDFEQLEALMLDKEPAPHLEDARKHYEMRVEALIKDADDATSGSVGGEGGDVLTYPILLPQEKDQLRQTAESIRTLSVSEAMQFRRIVLYIDDLDRCEPSKVVEILQAVNMLLSFRLFVVIVAVDARWLSRSLETKYRELFGPIGNDGPATGNSRSTPMDGDGISRATPIDYLEKIFQIPYWVPRMTDKTSARLVADLVSADRFSPGFPLPDAPFPPPPKPPDLSEPQPEMPPQQPAAQAQDNQPETSSAIGYALKLTGEEINALTALSPFVGGSPRRARRFVNVYRVAKASLTVGEIKRLEEGEFRPLATQLAIATGAPNAFGKWVQACAIASSKSIEEQLAGLAINPDERENLEGAIAAFRKMPGEGLDVLHRLVAQAARAARFSFVIPPKTSA